MESDNNGAKMDDSICNNREVDKSEESSQRQNTSSDNTAHAVKLKNILDHVQNCPAIFKNQQLGDPELSVEDKRSLAEDLLQKSPSGFLMRFGRFFNECHFDYFLSLDDPEVREHARQLKITYCQGNKRLQQRNRRYEALLRLEAEGSYFSEVEMEKRDPLLYHHLVGQYLTEKEKIVKNRQSKSNIIPTFSNFLIDKMERDEVTALRNSQLEAENECDYVTSEEENSKDKVDKGAMSRWGDDWIDAENAVKEKKKHKKKRKVHLSSKEKVLLVEEFKSLMYSKFLNGLEPDFNYEEVDSNSDYDPMNIKSQDEEDKYFDEESCSSNVCTDTGVEDY